MALRRNKSGTCCWRNNYWILLGSSDVSKSGLLSHPSHTAPQRKNTFLQIQSTARKVIFLISRKRLNILPKVVVLCLIYKYNELFIEVNQIHSWKKICLQEELQMEVNFIIFYYCLKTVIRILNFSAHYFLPCHHHRLKCQSFWVEVWRWVCGSSKSVTKVLIITVSVWPKLPPKKTWVRDVAVQLQTCWSVSGSEVVFFLPSGDELQPELF